jgi:hypothetical protein
MRPRPKPETFTSCQDEAEFAADMERIMLTLNSRPRTSSSAQNSNTRRNPV